VNNIMRSRRFTGLTAGLWLAAALTLGWPAAPAWAGAQDDQARDQWMNGYVKLEEAMKAENTSNQVVALQLYKEALAIFTSVRAKYPQWNASLLDYRISFCTERCRRLEQGVAASQSKLSREDLVTLSTSQRQQLLQLGRENLELKKQRDVTAQALDRARAEAAGATAAMGERDTLLRQLRETKEKLQAAEERETVLKKETDRLRQTEDNDPRRRQLTADLETAKAQAAEAQQKAETTQAALRNLTEQLRKAKRQAEDNRQEGAEARQAATEAEAARQTLETAAEEQTKQLRTANTELDTLRRDATRLREGMDQAAAEQRRLTAERDQERALREKLEKASPAEAKSAELEQLRGAQAKQEQDAGLLRQRASTAEQHAADLESALADLRQQETSHAAELTRQNNLLDALQRRNQETKEELARLKLDRDRTTPAEVQDHLRTVTVRATAAEAALSDLTKRETALGATVRSQESLLRTLTAAKADGEAQIAELKKQISASQQRAGTTERQLATTQDARLALDGMTATVATSAAAATAATNRAQNAERDLAMLQTRFREAVGERDLARAELSTERQRQRPGADALSEELRKVLRELDQEREKRGALEEALVKAEAATRDHAPASSSPLTPATITAADTDQKLLAKGFLQQGAAAEAQGRTETAVWNYRKALEHETQNPLALKRLGLIAAKAGDSAEAEKQLRLAFYANPDDVDVLLALGHTLVRENKTDLALSMLARAADLRPADAGIHRAYGIACSSLGWPDAAEAQLRRALGLDPKDRETAFNLAVLLTSKRPPALDEAREFYRQAKTLGLPPDPGLDQLLAP
jgi:Flp pilus assembly protein TadD